MNDRQQDPELLARFEQQKRVEASLTPSFANVMERAQAEAARAAGSTSPRDSRVLLRRFGWAGGLAAAAALAAVLVIPRTRSDEDAFEQAVQAFQSNPALGAWRSPTDGLLQVPGSQLMSTVPSVGSVQQ
jgi:hypothetical protein